MTFWVTLFVVILKHLQPRLSACIIYLGATSKDIARQPAGSVWVGFLPANHTKQKSRPEESCKKTTPNLALDGGITGSNHNNPTS